MRSTWNKVNFKNENRVLLTTRFSEFNADTARLRLPVRSTPAAAILACLGVEKQRIR